jgi:hypothetical protein
MYTTQRKQTLFTKPRLSSLFRNNQTILLFNNPSRKTPLPSNPPQKATPSKTL